MRHRKRAGKLKVSTSHHLAMRRNMISSLFEHGKVTTTMAKAKAFRSFAEKLITLARKGLDAKKTGTPEGAAKHLHAIRRAASYLPHKPAVRRLFREVAPAVGTRPGGFTRIVRMGTSRLGDNAPLALFMLVDTPIREGAAVGASAEEAANSESADS